MSDDPSLICLASFGDWPSMTFLRDKQSRLWINMQEVAAVMGMKQIRIPSRFQSRKWKNRHGKNCTYTTVEICRHIIETYKPRTQEAEKGKKILISCLNDTERWIEECQRREEIATADDIRTVLQGLR